MTALSDVKSFVPVFDDTHVLSVDELKDLIATELRKHDLTAGFDPHEARWPKDAPDGLGGQWRDETPGVGGTSLKKITPAHIYKKHPDGHVIGVSASGDKRLRVDGAKIVVEKRDKNGDYGSPTTIKKKDAYDQAIKKGLWHVPGQTSQTGTQQEDVKPSETPEQTSPVVVPAASETPTKSLLPRASEKPANPFLDEYFGPYITIKAGDAKKGDTLTNGVHVSHVDDKGIHGDGETFAIPSDEEIDVRRMLVPSVEVAAPEKKLLVSRQRVTATNRKSFNNDLNNASQGNDALNLVPSLADATNDTKNINAVETYQAGSGNINPLLRNEDKLSQDDQDIVDGIDHVIASSVVPSDIAVSRVIVHPKDIFGKLWKHNGDNSGLEWTDRAYTSTTTNDEVIDRFIEDELHGLYDFNDKDTHPVRMKILIRKNSHALHVLTGDPEWDYQDEVLLGRNSKFRIVNDHGVDESGMHTIDVEVVAEDELMDDLTAAAEVQTGAMIALRMSDEDIARLVVEDGEPEDQLHDTLVYLGEAAAFTPVMQEAILGAVAELSSGIAPFEADGFAIALFNPPGHTKPDGKDRDSCVVLLVSCEELEPIKEIMCKTVEAIYSPFELPEQHSPYVSHITLAYTETADLSSFVEKTSPVHFNAIRVTFAGEVYDFPLGESRDEGTAEEVTYDEDYEQGQGAYATNLAFVQKDINVPGSPGHQLHEYWTKNPKGLAKWAGKPHPWTSLYHHLRKYIHNDNEAKATAAKWFHDVKGYWPGDQKGKNPVGPG